MGARSIVRRVFGLDKRSLAVSRILMGALTCGDLIFVMVSDGMQQVCFWYSDDYNGIWKRADAIQHAPNWWSIHYVTGFCSLQYFIFLFHTVVAAAMMLGFRTQLTCFLNWLLTVSMWKRNTLMLDGGKDLMSQVLFWLMLLPTGEYFSIDNVIQSLHDADGESLLPQDSDEVTHVSLMAFGLKLNYFFLYLSAGLLKNSRVWIDRLEGLWRTTELGIFRSRSGELLLSMASREFFKFGTMFAIFLEDVVCWFLFPGGRVAFVAVLMMVSMHFGIFMLMNIPVFQMTCMFGLAALLPNVGIERLTNTARVVTVYVPSPNDGWASYAVCAALHLFNSFLCFEKLEIASAKQKDVDLGEYLFVVEGSTAREKKLFRGGEALLHLADCSIFTRIMAMFAHEPPQPFKSAKSTKGCEGTKKVSASSDAAKGRLSFLRRTGSSPRQRRGVGIARSIVFSALTVYAIVFIACRNYDSWADHGALPWDYHYHEDWTKPQRNSEVMGEKFNFFGYQLHLGHRWELFAPYPMTTDGYFVIVARQPDGVLLDLMQNSFEGEPVEHFANRPELVSSQFNGERWLKFFLNYLDSSRVDSHRSPFGRWICRRNNNVKTFTVLFVQSNLYKDSYERETPRVVLLWHHYCSNLYKKAFDYETKLWDDRKVYDVDVDEALRTVIPNELMPIPMTNEQFDKVYRESQGTGAESDMSEA